MTETQESLTARLVAQLGWHWDNQLRPKLDGLTDDEYLWEPVVGCWSIRLRAEAVTSMAVGGGDLVIDWEFPQPDPSPVTTIAWRMAHLTIGVFGARAASHFAGPPADYLTWSFAPTAAEGLRQLDDAYGRWITGAGALDPVGLERPVGTAEGAWANAAFAELVLHINREAIHHGAEILLLGDLYRSRD
jgi:DinB superfamily